MKRARAPGKIILSGEQRRRLRRPRHRLRHPPLYHRRLRTAAPQRTIRTALSGISAGKHYRTAALHRLKDKLDQRFEQYSRGERAVQNILRRPDDLVIYSLATLFQHLPMPGFSENRHLPVPGR